MVSAVLPVVPIFLLEVLVVGGVEFLDLAHVSPTRREIGVGVVSFPSNVSRIAWWNSGRNDLAHDFHYAIHLHVHLCHSLHPGILARVSWCNCLAA